MTIHLLYNDCYSMVKLK